jgi:hypothetical protein
MARAEKYIPLQVHSWPLAIFFSFEISSLPTIIEESK